MGWSKRDFVTHAFEEIGYASYVYDAMPEQLESVLSTLEAMLAMWNGKGIRIGYPLNSTDGKASLDEVTNVPDVANEAIYLNLAVRIGPRFGKVIPTETKQFAKEAYDGLLIKLAKPNEMQFPNTMPVGSGNKPWRRTNQPFLNPPVEQPDNDQTTEDVRDWSTS